MNETSARDDYERWYTEPAPNNRMLMALKSTIPKEVGWALDRLCRLSENDQFSLRLLKGLADALFEWPVWFATEGYKDMPPTHNLFSHAGDSARALQNAMESVFSLRNCSYIEANAQDIAEHPSKEPFVLSALHNLKDESGAYDEFLLYTLEMFQNVAYSFVLPPPPIPLEKNPFPPLLDLLANSSNRSLIIAAFNALSALLSVPSNGLHLDSASPGLLASIRYLPLIGDKPLLEASLNHLYNHLSQPQLAKAFLLHSQMSGTLKSLVNVLLREQEEDTFSSNLSGPLYTVPSSKVLTRVYNPTEEELNALIALPEPQRCYEWMRSMFVAKPDGVLTQIEFFSLYRETFAAASLHQPNNPMLNAPDVIKNVNIVFNQAQAMVVPGSPPTFVVRGVDRRRVEDGHEPFKCLWDRASCPTATFTSPSALHQHLTDDHLQGENTSCLWLSCPQVSISKPLLKSHVLTHLTNPGLGQKPASQSDLITLSSSDSPYPTSHPTSRVPPPPPDAILSYKTPRSQPPGTSLLALLSIRILFRISFASVDRATRADAEHFGFPGVVEEDSADQDVSSILDSEEEGADRKSVV